MPRISYGLATDVGMVRKNNEDAALAVILSRATSAGQDEIGLFAVADGMGGEKAGNMAAQLAVDKLASIVTEALISRLDDGLESSATDWMGILDEGFQRANRAILELQETSDELRVGGATMTAALVIGREVYVAHVGDTGAFLIGDMNSIGVLARLTEVHDFAHELIRQGHITWEELWKHPFDNVLYRALGQSEKLEVDTSTFHLLPNVTLLICSDGLVRGWKDINDEEMHKIIINADSPQQACNQLVVLANERGGWDNITVVVVKVEDSVL